MTFAQIKRMLRIVFVGSLVFGFASANTGIVLTPITLALADFQKMATAADLIFVKSLNSPPAGSGLRFDYYSYPHSKDGIGILTDGSVIYRYLSWHAHNSLETFAGRIPHLPQDLAHLKSLEPHLGAMKGFIVADLGVLLNFPPGASIGDVEKRVGADALKNAANRCLAAYKGEGLTPAVFINFRDENLTLSCDVASDKTLELKWATPRTTQIYTPYPIRQ